MMRTFQNKYIIIEENLTTNLDTSYKIHKDTLMVQDTVYVYCLELHSILIAQHKI